MDDHPNRLWNLLKNVRLVGCMGLSDSVKIGQKIFSFQYRAIKTSYFILFFVLQTIKDADLQQLSSLEYLDLSRNLIREIMPGTFLGMANLKGLDFSVNVVRKVKLYIDY